MFATASLLAALLPAAALGASTGPADSVAPVASSPGERPADPVARGVVVKTKATDATVRRATQRAAGPDVEVLAPDSLTGALTTVDFADTVPLEEAADVAAALSSRSDVQWAIPNGRLRATAASPNKPNDPLFGEQLQLWDAKATGSGGFATKMPLLWREAKGEGTVVAVLDTGIQPGHPDLRNQLVPGYDMVGADQDAFGGPLSSGDEFEFYTSNDGDGRDADPSDPGDWIPQDDTYCYGEELEEQEDSSWHGTHVAGIVAAQQGNGTGITGVAPAARIQPVRVLGRCGGWDSDVLAGIEWASGGSVPGVPDNQTPANVLNLSLGQYLEGDESLVSDYCIAYGDVMGRALERGAVTVVAAGNELGDADLSVPAACPHAISVAATSRSGRAAFYSNTGRTVDLSAFGGDFAVDGVGVLSSVDEGTTTPKRPDYAEYMGTSMAAPAVAGVAAALMADGRIQAPEVESALRMTVQPFAAAESRWSNYVIESPGGQPFRVDLNCTTSRCGAGVLDLSRLDVAVYLHIPWVRGTYGKGLDIATSANMHDRWSAQGSLELVRGSAVLARLPLDAGGWAPRTLSGTALPAGTYSVRTQYAGRWSSQAEKVFISKARSSVSQSIASTVSRRQKAKITVTVKVAGVPSPTGQLRVYDGKKRISTVNLSSTGLGKRVVTLPRLSKGKHRIKTVYVGTSNITGTTSSTRTVTSK